MPDLLLEFRLKCVFLLINAPAISMAESLNLFLARCFYWFLFWWIAFYSLEDKIYDIYEKKHPLKEGATSFKRVIYNQSIIFITFRGMAVGVVLVLLFMVWMGSDSCCSMDTCSWDWTSKFSGGNCC